ncbi:hypothetical protein [Actinoplanes sp. NPDC049802]|uniref:hypothetical protein n=1 Tax=Actinoplanes sp. NPDC049802 TaxID=3154742 RepID=UPI0033CD85F8
MTDRQTAAPETVEESRLTVALLAATALAWTGAMLWSARATITGRADVAMEVTSTAYALPGAVTADLVAGSAVALLVLTLVSGRRRLGPTARFAVATGTGLVVGLLSAIPIITINTAGTIYAVVGGTVAAAATIGGALAGLRIPTVVAAAGAGSVGVFLIGFLLNLFQAPVLNAFGAGDTESSAQAAQWFSYSQAALSGLAAGLIAYFMLRRHPGLRWPLYALAGAGAGLLLVIGELLARTAGAEVLELAGKVSELEQTVQRMLSSARMNNGLIVLFAGALTAIFAVGRTLGPARDDDEEAADRPLSAADDEKATSRTLDPADSAETAGRTPDPADEEDEDAKAKTPAGDGPQASSSNSETAYHSNS